MAENEIKKTELEEPRYLLFKLGKFFYATSLMSVQEVLAKVDFRPVPNARDYFLGIANVRGEVVGIIDLGKYLGISREPSEKNDKLVTIIFDTNSGPMGILVDDIMCVGDINQEDIDVNMVQKLVPGSKQVIGIAEYQGEFINILELKSTLDQIELVNG